MVEDVCGKLPQKVKYSQWKKVELEDGKKKMKIVEEEEVDKAKFEGLWKKSLSQFESHAERVRTQYQQMRFLKNNLQEDHVIVQMDFTENYFCQPSQEVESAHWNAPSMVTLHPAVFYFKGEDGNLTHQSIVYVSPVLDHNSSTVYAFLQNLVPEMRTYVPNLKHIHYFTDSPTSQHWNKSIFYFVTKHEIRFPSQCLLELFRGRPQKGPL